MIKILILLSIGFLPCISWSASHWGISNLIDVALKHNFDILAQRVITKQSSWNSWLSERDLYFPKLTYKLSTYKQREYEGPIIHEGNEYEQDLLYQSRLTFNYNLFNGLKDLRNKQYNQLSLQEEKERLFLRKEELIYKLKKQYFDHSLEVNRLQIYANELERDEKLLKSAQYRFKKGLIVRSDLSRTKVNFLSTKDRLRAQKIVIKNLRRNIQQTIGTDLPADVELTPLQYTDLEKEIHQLVDKLDTEGVEAVTNLFLGELEDQGTTLQILKHGVNKQEAKKSKILGDFLPSLNLNAYHYYRFQDNFATRQETDTEGVVVALTLTIPIFDSFDTTVAHKKELLELQRTKYKLQKERHTQKNSLQNLCRSLLSSYQSFLTVKEKLSLREYVYKTMVKQFQNGTVTTKDLIDDKINLENERLRLATISSNLRKTYLNIERITGKLRKLGG